jgi:hypothetical protein
MTGVGILSDFLCISNDTFELLFANNERLLDAWLALLHGARPEITAAVLHSLAHVLTQSDDVYAGSTSSSNGNDVGVASAAASTIYISAEAAAAAAENGRGDEATTTFLRGASMTRAVALKQRLWQSVGRSKNMTPMLFCLRLAKQPLESIRNAAMDVLAALASQNTSTWGLHVLFPSNSISLPIHAQADSFYSYILNRDTEFSKEGKDWKFSIITALSRNPSRAMLSEEVNKQIDMMVKQGPYHRFARMEEPLTLDRGAS